MADEKRTSSEVFLDMTNTRKINNSLWMTLAQIAYKHDPDGVKSVIRQISKNDSHVVDLWRELAADAPDD